MSYIVSNFIVFVIVIGVTYLVFFNINKDLIHNNFKSFLSMFCLSKNKLSVLAAGIVVFICFLSISCLSRDKHFQISSFSFFVFNVVNFLGSKKDEIVFSKNFVLLCISAGIYFGELLASSALFLSWLTKLKMWYNL